MDYFHFKGQSSENFHMVLLQTETAAFPVHGFHFSGSLDGYGGVYRDEGLNDQMVKVRCAVLSPDGESQLAQRMRLIAGWLQGEGELKLPQDGGLARRAWITSVGNVASKRTWGEIELTFRCHPLLLGAWQEVELGEECVIGGSAPARGILRTVLPNTAQTDVTFQYGEQSLTVTGVSPAEAVIEADTSLGKVTVNGEAANSKVPIRSRFFAVDAGEAVIQVQSDEGELSGTFRFRQRWY
ncbi:MAG: hypothetical protein HFE85_00210 [Clostridiales bacterium]|nr:hypothetical protein [Clostridiales bacterium]